MLRDRVAELHFITPIKNLPSVMQLGILSHNRAKAVPHISIAEPSVQDNRRKVTLPNGVRLHDYANLYFDARNPMMSARRDERLEIVVLRVHHSVLDLPGAVVTDGNAATGGTRFYPSPQGLAVLDEEPIYAVWWNDPNPWIKAEKKRQRCSEVLIPDSVPPRYLMGCFVYSKQVEQVCQSIGVSIGTVVRPGVFF